MEGDGARGKNSQELGRPVVVSDKADKLPGGINNLGSGRERESEELVVVMKRGNSRGAKGLRRKTS